MSSENIGSVDHIHNLDEIIIHIPRMFTKFKEGNKGKGKNKTKRQNKNTDKTFKTNNN